MVVLASYSFAFWPVWSTFGGQDRETTSWVLLVSALLTGVATSWTEVSWRRWVVVAVVSEAIGVAVAYGPHVGSAPAGWARLTFLVVSSTVAVFVPVLAASYTVVQARAATSGEVRWAVASARTFLVATAGFLSLISAGLVSRSLESLAFGLLVAACLARTFVWLLSTRGVVRAAD
jgi:hypothetical protein